ncbi:hypothetical protein OY671_008347, partial [Metschnikowia pulcherrima]
AELIRRTTRRSESTEQGARFHADVSAISASIDDAEARVAGRTSAPKGPSRIAAPTSFGRMFIAPSSPSFLERFPEVRIEIESSDGFTDSSAERIDSAIRITAQVERGSEAVRLAPSRRILCASPAYLAARGTPASIRDSAGHRSLAARGQLPWRLSANGRPVTIDAESVVATNSSEVVRESTSGGVGIASRSSWDIRPDSAEGRVVRVSPDLQGSDDVAIYAIRPAGQHMAASVGAFTEHSRRHFSPVPPWER